MNKLTQRVLIASLALATATSSSIAFAAGAEAASKKQCLAEKKVADKKDSDKKDESSTLLTVKDMTSAEALNQWMTYYYLHPQPELLVAGLLLSDKLGLLQGDAATPLQAFASRVLSQNPERLKVWYQDLAPISDNGKTLILTSLWWSGTKEGKEILDVIASQLPEKPRAEFRKQIDSTPPEIDKMDIESPSVLDMLWACFCATGDEKYVKRIVTFLANDKVDTKDLSKMMIRSTGRWSLISNIGQHEKVKTICESLKSDTAVQAFVEKALSEAAVKETANTGVKTDAKAEAEPAADKKKISKSERKKHKSAPVDLELKSEAKPADPSTQSKPEEKTADSAAKPNTESPAKTEAVQSPTTTEAVQSPAQSPEPAALAPTTTGSQVAGTEAQSK